MEKRFARALRSKVCAAFWLLLPALANAEVRTAGSVSTGSEVDTNVHRVESGTGDVRASGLSRVRATFSLVGLLKKIRAKAQGTVTSKLFWENQAQQENVSTAAVELATELATARGIVALSAQYYDAFRTFARDSVPVASGREFRTVATRAKWILSWQEDQEMAIDAGARMFSFKPNHAYDWNGPSLGAVIRRSFDVGDAKTAPASDAPETTLELMMASHAELRNYDSSARMNTCAEAMPVEPTCLGSSRVNRHDWVWSFQAELLFSTDKIYAVSYNVEEVRSNSYGESLRRHRLRLGLTTELPWRVLLDAELSILYNQFSDAILLAGTNELSFVTIEDENRNGLVLHFLRPISKSLSAEVRVSSFRNEFATDQHTFRRSTMYAGLVLAY